VGVENARVENAGVDSRGGKCRSGKYRSDNVWKGFLNIISGWCSIRFTPAFSTAAIYSCIFHPCNFARIAFSTPTFSVAPTE